MKKSILKLLSLILALMMLTSAFAACFDGEDETSGTDATTGTGSGTESGSGTDTDTDTESGSETDNGTESDTDDVTDVELEGPFGDSIVNANKVANGVQSYYTSGDRGEIGRAHV